MTGRVIRVNVEPGQEMKEGGLLLVIEAMKMENEVLAPQAPASTRETCWLSST